MGRGWRGVGRGGAISGSLERFFGILMENYAGAFPLWLAPVQARLLLVNDAVMPYAQEVGGMGGWGSCTGGGGWGRVRMWVGRGW